MKSQIIINRLTKEIICVYLDGGRKHDYRLYKESNVVMLGRIDKWFDTAYIAEKKKSKNDKNGKNDKTGCVYIPKKKSKKHPLTPEDKKQNHYISSVRICVEHVIRRLKIFKILAEKYRNRRRRLGLRLNLIAAIINMQL